MKLAMQYLYIISAILSFVLFAAHTISALTGGYKIQTQERNYGLFIMAILVGVITMMCIGFIQVG